MGVHCGFLRGGGCPGAVRGARRSVEMVV
jgi:hypothetical protein